MEIKKHYKKIFAVATVLVVCITIILTAIIIANRPMYIQANGFNSDSKNNISVSAEGKITVKPDLAIFTVGYKVKNDSLKEVQKQLEEISNDIYASLKKSGINEKDIKTVDYSINPNYYWNNNKEYFDGHSGSISIQVKVRKLNTVGDVIDSAVDSGANIVSSISFTVEDQEAYKEKARIEATKLAKAKAETLADAAGANLGGLLYISESSYTPSPYYYSMEDVKSSAGKSSTQISAGSFEVTVNVSATFAIE